MAAPIRTLLPWMARGARVLTVVSKHRNVLTIRGPVTREILDTGSNLVSSMFAGNDHLFPINSQTMAAASLAPGFSTPTKEKLSAKLIDISPVDKEHAAVWYGCSGCDAVSTAVMDAVGRTGVPGVFRVEDSFHGAGPHTAQIGTDPRGKSNRSRHVAVDVVIPTVPRPRNAADAERCLDAADALFKEHRDRARTLVFEGSSGTAHGGVWPEGYLHALASVARDNDVLLVADEVLSGLMRCGAGLWSAAARDDATTSDSPREPLRVDYVCYGKALTNGTLPMSAVVMADGRPYVDEPWDHGATFSGYPIGVEVAIRQLNELERRQSDVAALTDTLQVEMAKFGTIPAVADVRGQGLLWTIVLGDVALAETVRKVVLHDHGVRAFGLHDQLKVAPSVDDVEIPEALGIIRGVLSAHTDATL